jgi:hypothetical protein
MNESKYSNVCGNVSLTGGRCDFPQLSRAKTNQDPRWRSRSGTGVVVVKCFGVLHGSHEQKAQTTEIDTKSIPLNRWDARTNTGRGTCPFL